MTEAPRLNKIGELCGDAQEALLRLNNEHAEQTSFLQPERWHQLVAEAFIALSVADEGGFMIALDERANYDSTNYAWFKARFRRFAYVDRIVVGEEHRGSGLARHLYAALFEAAREAGQTRVCCEVNRVPPNPGSDAFHARLGFQALDVVALEGGKVVTYLCREL